MTYSLEEKEGEQNLAMPGKADRLALRRKRTTSRNGSKGDAQHGVQSALRIIRPYYLSSTCAPASSS